MKNDGASGCSRVVWQWCNVVVTFVPAGMFG